MSKHILKSLLIFVAGITLTPSIWGHGWTQTFGGSGSDWGSSVQQTTDGGYVITGATDPYANNVLDVWLIKTNSVGEEEWSQTFGGSGSEWGSSGQQTSDGGYIIVSSTDSYGNGDRDVWLIKTDSLGNEEWNRTFHGVGYDWGSSVQQTTDGGYIIAGRTTIIGTSMDDAWLIKTDSLGNKEWDKTFGGNGSDQSHSVQQTSDGGYIMVGSTDSLAIGLDDAWLIKTDSQGNEEWTQTYGGDDWDMAYCVRQTTDGGYIITGTTRSYGNFYQAWLVKTDSLGNEEWAQTFGGSGSDWGMAGQQTADGGYILTGSLMDVWLIKTDSQGNEVWNQTFGGARPDFGNSVQQTVDGGYIIAGQTYSYGNGLDDVWLIKTDSQGSLEVFHPTGSPDSFDLSQPYPNPFNTTTTIKFSIYQSDLVTVKVYDVLGREVTTIMSDYLPIGYYSIGWTVDQQSSGLYFIRLESSDFIKTKKVMLLK